MIDPRGVNREIACALPESIKINKENNNSSIPEDRSVVSSSLSLFLSSFPTKKSIPVGLSSPQDRQSFFKTKKKSRKKNNKTVASSTSCFHNSDSTAMSNSSDLLPDSSASRHNCDLVMQLLAAGELDELSISSSQSLPKTETDDVLVAADANDALPAATSLMTTNKSSSITSTPATVTSTTTQTSSSSSSSPAVSITTPPSLSTTKAGSFRVEVVLKQKDEHLPEISDKNMRRSKSCPEKTLVCSDRNKNNLNGILITSASPAAAVSDANSNRSKERKNHKRTTTKSSNKLTTKAAPPSAPVDALEQQQQRGEQRVCSPRRRKNKSNLHVRFGSIEIREHPIMMGDNPGGFQGPPLTIDWVSHRCVTLPLDDYEANRPPRRSNAQINIPHHVRQDMLLQAGYSRGLIREKVREVNIARRNRKRTIEVMKMTPFHEGMERVVRSSLNFTIRRRKKKRERDFIRLAWKIHEKAVMEQKEWKICQDDRYTCSGDDANRKGDDYVIDDDDEDWDDVNSVVNRG